jgi:hypothetical protein
MALPRERWPMAWRRRKPSPCRAGGVRAGGRQADRRISRRRNRRGTTGMRSAQGIRHVRRKRAEAQAASAGQGGARSIQKGRVLRGLSRRSIQNRRAIDWRMEARYWEDPRARGESQRCSAAQLPQGIQAYCARRGGYSDIWPHLRISLGERRSGPSWTQLICLEGALG